MNSFKIKVSNPTTSNNYGVFSLKELVDVLVNPIETGVDAVSLYYDFKHNELEFELDNKEQLIAFAKDLRAHDQLPLPDDAIEKYIDLYINSINCLEAKPKALHSMKEAKEHCT